MKWFSISPLSIWVLVPLLLFIPAKDGLAKKSNLGFDDLVDFSDLVIRGKVVNKVFYKDDILMDTVSRDGKGGKIHRTETWNETLTDYEIEISDIYKGEYKKPTILLTVVGGVIGDVRLSTNNSFYLTMDEHYYFFLLYDKRNHKWKASWHRQGVYEEMEADGNKYILSVDGFTVIDSKGNFSSNKKTANAQKSGIAELEPRIKEGNRRD